MAKRITKIESLGLADEVQELVSKGFSGRRIAARIRATHPDIDISDSAVIRYVGEVRTEAEEEAFAQIRRHVDRVVPDDLKAILVSGTNELERRALVDRSMEVDDTSPDANGDDVVPELTLLLYELPRRDAACHGEP